MASCSGPGNKNNSGDTARPDNSQASEISAKRKLRLLNLEELVRKRASTKHWPAWQTTWDLTLNEILDEEDVLQECKAQNMKLIDFLILPSNIEELVNYVTQEPSDDTDEKLRYKYPNTACELLISDVTQITAKLAGDDALMAKIYSFLENEAPLNPLLASFFSKVMGLLITRKSERMLEFLKSKEDFISHLLHHLGTSAIMDLLLRLITCIEAPKYHMMCLNWLSEQQLIQKLVAMIDPSQPEEKHCNACQSLCDIIRLSREQMSQLQDRAEPDPLLATIESEETITELLNHMFDGEKVESVLVSGIAVIQNLLEYKRLTPDGGTEAITSLDAQRLNHGICNTVNAVIPRLKDFHQLLQDPPKQYYSPMVTTVGTLNPPFGNTRLQTARLIASLLFTRTHRINVELANLGTLGVLLDLCFEYMWNNFLHTQVEQSIASVLNDEPSEEGEDHKDNPLLSQLFVKHKLIEKILDVWDENDQHQSRPGGHRKGYMGHLTKIANHVVDSMEKGSNCEKIKGYFEALPENVKERWNQFVSGPLAEINKQNTVVLVSTSAGQNLYSSSEEDDPDFKDITFPQDNAMDQAFADYQLQQMTSNFIDQFGFNEEDFAESEEWISEKFKEQICSINFDINTDEITNTRTLFDHVCNEKIHQFDDQDSEEDLWEDKEITFSQSSGSRQNSTSGGASGQPAVPPAATTDSDREQSDSSDSEEELDSPRQIHQSPSSSAPQCIIADSTTTEKMDVDNSEGWANFDDISMETSPALAVTDPGPVVWQSEQNMSSAVTSDNWAKFNSESSDSVIKVPSDKSDMSLADFTNLNASGNESSEAQGRSRSPVAMDTNELSSNTSSRVAAYLVSSAPADLASTINEATEASNAQNKEQKQEKLSGEDVGSEHTTSSNTVTSSDISSIQTASCDVPTQPDSHSSEQAVTEETKNVLSPAKVVAPPGATSKESTLTPDHVIISSDVSCDKTVMENLEEEELDSTQTICDNIPESADTEMDNTKENISSAKDPATAFDDGNDKDDDDDDELIDNFNFLASAGLMKCSDEPDTSKPTSQAQDASPSLPDSTATDQSDLGKARAQAKEALEQFEAATSTSPSQNGPV